MPRSITRSFRCPCGTTFNTTIYKAVNIAEEPHLQYVVLAGLLNVATCPSCGRRAALAYPFIYHDRAHNLLVYVHPRSEVTDEERQRILEQLQKIYAAAVATSESQTPDNVHNMPPLQVVFGIDQLIELINQSLPPEELLGKLALNTRSRRPEERQRLLQIAREMARQVGCQVEDQEDDDEYTVWLYGPRRIIGAIMRELAPRH
jgi:hypothetical protein